MIFAPLGLCASPFIRYRLRVSATCDTIGIGLAGFGTVGSGVWNLLARNGGLIADRARDALRFEIRRIVVRDPEKTREVAVPAELLTADWQSVIADPSVDVVVELIGGTDVAYEMVAAALTAGKPVVTGNKALLA